jgi:hypothetical protein
MLMNCWQKVYDMQMNFLVDGDEMMSMNVWQNFDEMQMKMLMNC